MLKKTQHKEGQKQPKGSQKSKQTKTQPPKKSFSSEFDPSESQNHKMLLITLYHQEAAEHSSQRVTILCLSRNLRLSRLPMVTHGSAIVEGTPVTPQFQLRGQPSLCHSRETPSCPPQGPPIEGSSSQRFLSCTAKGLSGGRWRVTS